MFRGRFEYTIDDKGRTSLPAKFREVLAAQNDERLIVTTFDKCLWGYPVKEWLTIEEKIASLPQFKPEVKALQRMFVSGAAECPLDKQGRIILPASLRDYAELKKEIVFVGMTKRIEIWSKENWNKAMAMNQVALESMGEGLANLGL